MEDDGKKFSGFMDYLAGRRGGTTTAPKVTIETQHKINALRLQS